MKYIVSYKTHHQHFIDIELVVDSAPDKLQVQLAAWRPGRYELGNFSKNVRSWGAFDKKGAPLNFTKLNKDLWEVSTNGNKEVHIKYSYYAAELNAGSTFLDDRQLYMNPVNCIMYVPGRENEPVQMEMLLPEGYQVAVALKMDAPKKEGNLFRHALHADNYERLADSPLIASPTLKHNNFVMDGIEFHLWIQGECKPDWAKMINDFFIFINEQVNMMKGCPVKEYHFLFQVMPYRFHHGVEHLASTVIAMGPAYNLMKDELYNNFLGISCHELFHSWNIKTIRPVEMYPYDYTKENYSRLGYVYEGITTYYGDYLLYRAGVFNEFEYLKAVQNEFQKHFDNYGRFSLSVAGSSFDTWLDGYVSGIPHRKVSIYTEGCMLAFIVDMFIRKHTSNKKSLDDVMRVLYHDYALKGKPYTEADYRNIVEATAGTSCANIFDNYINTAADLEKPLFEALSYIGLGLLTSPSKKHFERYWGIKATEEHGAYKVTIVAPDSPAEAAGICAGDDITMVNGHALKGNFNDWCAFYDMDEVTVTVVSDQLRREVKVKPVHGKEFYKNFHVIKLRGASLEQQAAYRIWCNRDF
jgi:predicted metalloprotease with PDZ domain